MSDDGVDFRAMMSDYWTSQWKNVKFPKKGSASTVFDYYLDPKTNDFEPWVLTQCVELELELDLVLKMT